MIEFFCGNEWRVGPELVHIIAGAIIYDKTYGDISFSLILFGFGFTIVIGV
jgi:hypothetical protein